MTWRLHTDGLDHEPAATDFASAPAAIAYAAWWFLDGYVDNDTMPGMPDETVLEDLDELLSDLRAGREFYCSRFYEKVRLEELPAV